MINEIVTHIHSILVHFPIAMIVIGLCYDLFAAWKNRSLTPSKGLWIWFVSALTAWLSVATGPEHDARGNTSFLDLHSTLADITAWAVTLLLAWRLWMVWKGNRSFVKVTLAGYLILSLLSCVLVLGTGYYGGKMVYSDGVGVKVNGNDVNPPKARHIKQAEKAQ
ncbi:DUF2231 domain-containing protein [Paenibacillus thalictri]|uniref:DUF2231 domain-containing protein n=1 Tax=Paenibacillus thalictri TaxID=2527873 RepID=A0A4Q9DMF1_9BACL|nr:DUF2231 domain-containing protein [Paenibacillus thalictri]TBL76457.1 hypothetical protein EYB31_18645 [Paenibacillus thalictri]